MKTKTFLVKDFKGNNIRVVQQGQKYKLYLSGVGLIEDEYISKHPSNTKAFINHLHKYLKTIYLNYETVKGYLIW